MKNLLPTKYWLFIIGGMILIPLIIYAAQYYRSDPGTTITVNEHGICKRVVNSGPNSYFIPTKTLNEWNLFKANKPASVSLGSCYQCPDNGQIYSDSSSCSSACTQTASCTTQISYSQVKGVPGGPCGWSYCIWGSCYPSAPENGPIGSQVGKGFYDCSGVGYYAYFYQLTNTTCPLSGGSACSGSPLTCTKSTSCTTLP